MALNCLVVKILLISLTWQLEIRNYFQLININYEIFENSLNHQKAGEKYLGLDGNNGFR